MVRLQTQAVLSILALPSDAAELIRSEAQAYENSLNPLQGRREAVEEWISQVPLSTFPELELTARTSQLIAMGFAPFDAVHLATAEMAASDCLVTVDLKFLRLATRVADLRCRVIDPVTLIEELSQWTH
jgi:hypothetical protein